MSLIAKRVRLSDQFTPITRGDWIPSQYFITNERGFVFMPTEVGIGNTLKFRQSDRTAYILKEL